MILFQCCQTQAEKAEAKEAQISICFSDMQISTLPKHDLLCKNFEAQIKCRKCSELEYEESAVKKEKCKKCYEMIDNEDLYKNRLYSHSKTHNQVENKSIQTEIVKTIVTDENDYNEIVASKKEILIKEVINSESQTICSESMKRAMITDSQLSLIHI